MVVGEGCASCVRLLRPSIQGVAGGTPPGAPRQRALRSLHSRLRSSRESGGRGGRTSPGAVVVEGAECSARGRADPLMTCQPAGRRSRWSLVRAAHPVGLLRPVEELAPFAHAGSLPPRHVGPPCLTPPSDECYPCARTPVTYEPRLCRATGRGLCAPCVCGFTARVARWGTFAGVGACAPYPSLGRSFFARAA
jgi:hypothetical protein